MVKLFLLTVSPLGLAFSITLIIYLCISRRALSLKLHCAEEETNLKVAAATDYPAGRPKA